MKANPTGAPASQLVVCPVLIGRGEQLGSLDRVIELVIGGSGQTAAVSGEAGIGKSRLVAETKARMVARGACVMQGHCFEPDATLPYAPVVDMFRGYLTAQPRGEIGDLLGTDAAELAKLLPELTSLIEGVEPAAPLEPEQEKRRLFLALAQFFGRIAARGPLLVVVEDLHWSDETSLEFLLYAARRVAGVPILLLITYRSDEIQPAFGHFMAQLERERLVTEWPLTHLGAAEVDAMIRAIFDLKAPVRRDFVEAIRSLTEGNPFFIEEVLKSLVASGDIFFADGNWDRKPIDELNIPRSVHDAVMVRTQQLSDDARHVLTVAAIMGRRFEFSLLQRVTGQDDKALLAILKELIAAQLVVEDDGDHFAFRHALTQHVIYNELLVMERRALHREIADQIRQVHASSIDAHLADLAHHFYQARAWDEAYYYCRRVGENAQRLYASGAVVEHLTRALEAASHLAVTPPAGLYRTRGQAYELLGDFDRARADYELALTTARSGSQLLAEWQALIDIGALWAGLDYDRTGEFFRDATELARAMGDQALIGQSLNRLGNWLANTGQAAEALQAHGDALAIFDALGDEQGRADTLDLTGMANGLNGNMVDCLTNVGQAIPIFRRLGDDQGLVSSLASRGTYSTPSMHDVTEGARCSFEAAYADSTEAIALARRIGWQSGRAYGEFTAASVSGGFGEFGKALFHGHESLRLATRIGHKQWEIGAQFTLGQAYVRMGIAELALEHLETAFPQAQRLGSAWWLGNVGSCLAQAFLLNGEPARARDVLSATMPRDQQPLTLGQRRLSLAWAELALAERDWGVAIRLASALLDSVPGAQAVRPIPLVLIVRARAYASLRRTEEAEHDLEAGRDEASARGDRPTLWRAWSELARLYDQSSRREAAATARAQALAIVETLAGTIDDEALRVRFLAKAEASLPAERVPSSREAQKAAFGGLTARERDVAGLIARGMSNRDIADELVLGERTIETHVGNILSKLGFSSRAQVAAWAVEIGLAGSRAQNQEPR